MARKVGSSKLDTRSARLRLAPRREPHWIKVQRGLSLGYRRTATPDGSWIARFYDPARTPSRTYKALGSADDHTDADGLDVLTFDQAQQAARGWLAKLKAPVACLGSVTVAEACERYLTYLKAKRSVNSHLKTKSKIGKHILPALGAKTVAALTVRELEAWQLGMVRVRDGDEGERRNKDTANRALTDLKAALNRLYPKAERAGKPWNEIQRFKGVGKARIGTLDTEQCQRFIDAATAVSPAFGQLVTATLLVGWRPPQEVEKVTVRDFNPAERTLHLPRGKNGPRTITLTAEATAFFAEIAGGRAPEETLLVQDDGQPWREGSQRHLLPAAVEAGKLPEGTCLYTCRHTYATQCIANGMNLFTLAENMGTSVKMLQDHYVQLRDHAKRRAVEASGFKLGLRLVKTAA